MNITKAIARLRGAYHWRMIDVVDIANRFKLIGDTKAYQLMKKHYKKAAKCDERYGYVLPLRMLCGFMNEGD